MGRRTVMGAILLAFAFGSLHAYGVLLEPLERELGTDRAIASLGYSIAIVTLTLGVFLSRTIAGYFSPRRLALLIGTLGALGVSIAASGTGVVTFLLGYGVIFGFSNGLAYSLFLKQAAAALPRARGLAIGTVTAVYGLGAAVFTQCLGAIASSQSVGVALWFMALSVMIAGVGSSFAFTLSSAPSADVVRASKGLRVPTGQLVRLWFVYFLGACGGLMVIAHAAAIMSDIGASPWLAQHAATLSAVGNVVGSALGGLWADRVASRRALAAPLLVSIVAMATLRLTGSGWVVPAMLSLCGLSYGALIAIVPVVVRRDYGAPNFNWAFGVVFTAWGAAGLAGPYLAAALHDLRGDYAAAISAAIVSAVIALLLIAVPKELRWPS